MFDDAEVLAETIDVLREGRPLRAVASEIGVHQSILSRLRAGTLPGPETRLRIERWMNAAAGQAEVIFGRGVLHESESETRADQIQQARELLQSGAVGVSVGMDINPEDLQDVDLDDFDAVEQALGEAGVRIRHLAIEDTAAFADAHIVLDDDGQWSGPIVYQSTVTGDVRLFDHIVIDESILPISLKLGHDGPVVGEVTAMWRDELPEPVQPNASILTSAVPDRLFAKPEPGPVRYEQVGDFLRVSGSGIPAKTCHRGVPGRCETYPPNKVSLKHFHTGSIVTCESGEQVRLGTLTVGGPHAPAGVKPGDWHENTRAVFASVKAWNTPDGLLFSGVVVNPDDHALLNAVASCAPSYEIRPTHADGVAVFNLHIVTTPGMPANASTDASTVAELVDRLAQLEDVVRELFAAHVQANL